MQLGTLALETLRHRKARAALTGGGIALAVALYFGAVVANATASRAVDRFVRETTGRADILVSPLFTLDTTSGLPAMRTEGLPATLDTTVRALPGVADAIPAFGFATGLRTTTESSHADPAEVKWPLLMGLEPDAGQRLWTFSTEEGRLFSPTGSEIVVPHALARQLGIRPSTRVSLSTPTGMQEALVVGILRDTGAGALNRGQVAFTSLSHARALADAPDGLSLISIILHPDHEPETWIRRHRQGLPDGVNIQASSGPASQIRRGLTGLTRSFQTFGAAVFLVAGFLIHLTLSVAIVERTRSYATLLALGATRNQVRLVVVSEALVIGVVATAVGLALGPAVAWLLATAVSAVSGPYRAALVLPPDGLIGALILGLVTTVLAALVPARRAARIDPVVAMRGDHRARARPTRWWIAGVVIFLIGAALTVTRTNAVALAFPLLVAGVVLMTPALLRPLAAALGTITGKASRGVGAVAVMHLVKERSRSAHTLALIMIAMTITIALGVTYTSTDHAITRLVDASVGTNLVLEGAPSFDTNFIEAVRRVRGVSGVTPSAVATTRIEGQDKTVPVAVLDPATYQDLRRADTALGAPRATDLTHLQPQQVIVPLSLRSAKQIKLETRLGLQHFTVAGTYRGAGTNPAVVIGFHDGERFFGVDRPTQLTVSLEDGVSAEDGRRTVTEELGDKAAFVIQSTSDIQAGVRQQVTRLLRGFFVIPLLIGIIGFLGLVSTLAACVLERFREIGVLRALGTEPRQVAGMVLAESFTLTLVAFLLSVPLGMLCAIPLLDQVREGVRIPVAFAYPIGLAVIVATFGSVAGLAAAVGPGRRASRLDVVAALRYD